MNLLINRVSELRKIIEKHKQKIEKMTEALLERETLNHRDIEIRQLVIQQQIPQLLDTIHHIYLCLVVPLPKLSP